MVGVWVIEKPSPQSVSFPSIHNKVLELTTQEVKTQSNYKCTGSFALMAVWFV